MPEQKIIRTAIIVVDSVDTNSFGDLTFIDKESIGYKVSEKRKPYFEKIIVPGAAVQLNYAMSSFGKEYIYSAVQIKDKLPAPIELTKQPATEPTKTPGGKTPEVMMTKEDWAEKDRTIRKSIERQVALREAVELAKIKGVDSTEKVVATATYFETYLETGKVPAKKGLVEEAKNLGAAETEGK